MYTKRGGRIQVNRLQFQELVERVRVLEEAFKELNGSGNEAGEGKTKPEIMGKLKDLGIEFNPRDKKEILESLLNGAINAEES